MVNFLRYSKIFKAYELVQPFLKYSLPLENKLPLDKVMVIAPHPDDESIGCGGVLKLHSDSGGSIVAVFCTIDGEQRKNEAKAAAKILGIKDSIFLDYPVESLKKQKSLTERLVSIFDEKKPEIVFVPFLIDNHVDHRAVNEALVKIALKKKYDFMIYAYPVWFPLYPNVLTDISGIWEKKKEAISCYKSQLSTRDYIGMSYALSQYWAKVKGREIEVVETFFKATFSEYVQLGRKILGK